jgi:GNAT superfamily N-acetyltransferase
VIRPFDPSHDSEHQTLVALALAQQARLQALMPGLLASPTQASIAQRLQEATHLLVVEDASGKVRAAAEPAVWEVRRESILRAFVSGRNGIARHVILPSPQEPDAEVITKTLLQALEDSWRILETEADVLRWPAQDAWVAPLLAAHGFQLDSICATRSLDPFFATPPAAPSGLHVRVAKPSDEAALLRLFYEELCFHERFTPFVRSSSEVLQAFHRKLERLWSAESFEDGSPLIVVAGYGDKVIAMAEHTLVTLTTDDEPGFTPPGRYWCIDHVSVLEAFHCQGIGRALLQATESMRLAQTLNLTGYLLWYNPSNTTAARFWEHRGFLPVWTTYQRRNVREGA